MKFTHASIAGIILVCLIVSWHFFRYSPHFSELDNAQPTTFSSRVHQVNYGKNLWIIDADQSQYYKAEQKLLLKGHVKLTQPKTAIAPATHIRTDHATIFINTKQLETDAPVYIDRGLTHIQGIGATANETTGVAHLLANTTGHYVNENDKTQAPADISSDQLIYQSHQHRAIYIGHVIATQQQSQLHGDKMIVDIDPITKQVSQMITTGHQATYTSINPTNHLVTHAQSDTIIYDPKTHLIHLNGHAVVTRNGNTIRAPNIIYNQITGAAHSFDASLHHAPTYITVAPSEPK